MPRSSRRRVPLPRRMFAALCALAFPSSIGVGRLFPVTNTLGGLAAGSLATQVGAANGGASTPSTSSRAAPARSIWRGISGSAEPRR